VKTPRPIEEPGTLTRRSKDPRPLRLGVAVKYDRDAEYYIGQVAYIILYGTFGEDPFTETRCTGFLGNFKPPHPR
jgi:hypothetical protein